MAMSMSSGDRAVIGSLSLRVRRTVAVWRAFLNPLFDEEPSHESGESRMIVWLDGGEIVLTDRRTGSPRTFRLKSDADDVGEQLAAVHGSDAEPVRVRVLIDPADCFIRKLTLPVQVLPRMRDVLIQELEAATPFKAADVYTDWYVESEETGRLNVRHVVMKKASLEPLLSMLTNAGFTAAGVNVGTSESKVIPVNLLTGGRRPMPRLLRRIRPGDAILVSLGIVLVCCAMHLVRSHQDAVASAIDRAIADTNAHSPAELPVRVRSELATLVGARAAHPPLAVVWSSLAQLPPVFSILTLHMDASSLVVTLVAPSEGEARRALAVMPIFGPARIQPVGMNGDNRFIVVLPWRGGAL